MGVDSDRSRRDATDSNASDPGPGDHGREDHDREDHEKSSGNVHVRRLTVADTLRWSWATLRDRPSLVGLALAANLPSVAAAVGVTRPSPSADLDVALWVWPAYLVQLVAVAVVAGAVYLTAADAVAYRTRSLSTRVRAAARRLPALAATGVVLAVVAGLGFLPGYLLEWEALPGVDDGLLAVLSLLALVLAAYALLRLLLAFPACVVDDAGPLASSRAGWGAATGIVRKVFAVGVVYLVASVASAVVSGLFGGEYDVASTLASAVTGAVVLPFFGLALAHLYLEGSRNR
ncbi:hypothetical protein [Halorussus litoreus]|uniref:hypothetical protein n=1 Tax=Halorussus litoreus TaxID=1710536 RepID=UPI000E2775F9|nr:hypothetical protein [Halorussus litoreus]